MNNKKDNNFIESVREADLKKKNTVVDIPVVKTKSFTKLLLGKGIMAIIFLAILFYLAFRILDIAGISGENLALATKDDYSLRANLEAEVTLVMYGDYADSTSRFYYSIVQGILKKYPDDLFFVYRPYPLLLDTIKSSLSAEAAGLQGRYWHMSDILFTNRLEWVDLTGKDLESKLEKYALSIGLDMFKYRKDVVSLSVSEKIQNHLLIGKKLQVTETPTFFLNGKKISTKSVEDFSIIIEQTLLNAQGVVVSPEVTVPDSLLADDWVLIVGSSTDDGVDNVDLVEVTVATSTDIITVEDDEDVYLKFLDLTDGKEESVEEEIEDDSVVYLPNGTKLKIKEVNIYASGYTLLPQSITIIEGTRLDISFVVRQGYHGLVIDGFEEHVDPVGPGLTKEISVMFSEEGSYEFYCPVGNNRSLGQFGTITVKPR